MCYTMHMEKIDARKLSTGAQQQLRYQAIRLRKQGTTESKAQHKGRYVASLIML